ncbi:hypothetical protein Kfla_4350 [Kribbella flavida DSM 17836]|uniref:Uncharacterized protein n=1 Tax=Kribbella flavida (strain DSM 17836 / JCM 10339 / NBRC 14399) TaxID=479435 RepID=D2PVA3_KRIFD|nr:hypothetical protein [Kribbella flavida]ADB33384.1 hypothetical protein Kfla_4350 [Kribbella flavida DSM 17836]
MEFIIPIAVVVFIALATRALNARSTGGRNPGTPSPRVQRLLERLEAQQRGAQPMGPTGQYTQPAPYAGGGGGPVGDGYGTPGNPNMPVQSSTQMAGVLDHRRHAAQSGHQPSTPGQHATGPYPGQAVPGQFPNQYAPPGPPPSMPFGQPGQFQPPGPWFQQAPPQSYQLPAVKPSLSPRDIDARVREMMRTGNEVGAVRLLCDEQDLGIIDAQKRARALVAPAGGPGNGSGGSADRVRSVGERPESASSGSGASDEETRYVGSAAFAQSLFDTDRDDEESWASGWVDPPDPGDRTDIQELWQTVRDGRSRD